MFVMKQAVNPHLYDWYQPLWKPSSFGTDHNSTFP